MKNCIIIIIFLFTFKSWPFDLDKIKYMYGSGSYSEIIEITAELQNNPGKDIESAFYRGLACFRLDNLKESKKLFYSISSRSDNIYMKESALYFLALTKIRLDETQEAVVILTGLLNSSRFDVSDNSRAVLEALINGRINEEDFKDLKNSIFDRSVLKYINQSRTSLNILAVLPLTGTDKDAGNGLLSGLEFAVKNMNLKGRKIRLDIVNSEGRIPVMVKKVLERLNSSKYNLIIGELRSDATAALAGIASLKNIPLVSPTASANNISDISRFIFQLNTTSYSMSKMIAEYAIDSLDYKTFAILAPASDDGNESVTGFTEKVVEKGCSILSTEWYYDAYDVNKQLQRIRENILEICSLDKQEYMLSDSIRTFKAPIIDAIFLPVPNSDIESVLSQVSYYNFKANILGTYGWNDPGMLNKLGANADSLVFIKESSYDSENPKFNDFVFSFRKETNSNPKNMEIIGYSLIEMLVSIQRENPDKSIIQLLTDLREYDSISGKIYLKDKRTNLSSNINIYSSKRKELAKKSYQEISKKDTLEISNRFYNSGYVSEVTGKYSSATDNYTKSMDEFRKAVNLPDSSLVKDPGYNKIKKRLGNSYYMTGDHKKAFPYFADVVKSGYGDPEIIFKHAVTGSGTDPEGSIKVLKTFLTDRNYSSEAYFEIGKIYENQQQSSKAAEYYENAAKLKNNKAIQLLKSNKK